MELLDAKLELISAVGAHPDVRGIGVVDEQTLGVYLWEETTLNIPSLDGWTVNVYLPGEEPVKPEKPAEAASTDDVTDEYSDDDIPF